MLAFVEKAIGSPQLQLATDVMQWAVAVMRFASPASGVIDLQVILSPFSPRNFGLPRFCASLDARCSALEAQLTENPEILYVEPTYSPLFLLSMAKTQQPSQQPNGANRFAAKANAVDPALAALFASSVSAGLSGH